MGGGGSKPKTSTTTSGVPDWSQPYVESAAKDAQNLYKSGQFDKVAGFTRDQTNAQAGIRGLQGESGQFQRRADTLSYGADRRMGKANDLELGADRLTGASIGREGAANSLASGANILAGQAGTNQAFGQAQNTFGDAAGAQGVFSANRHGQVADQMRGQIDNQVTRALGQQQGQFAQTGNLGGARAQAAAASAAGQISSDMAASEVAAQRANAQAGAGAAIDAANSQWGQRLQGANLKTDAFNSQGQAFNDRINAQNQQTNAFNSQGQAFQDQNTALGQQANAFQMKAAANQMLNQSGQDQQDQQQAQADAKYQGIQRMFGLVNPNTVGTKSETTSTGGK